MVSNWVMTDVLRVAGDRSLTMSQFPVSPERLAGMIALVNDGTISGKIAKEVFEGMLASSDDPRTIVKKKGLLQISDASSIERAVDEVLRANKPQVEQYLQGSAKVFGFFVGETMKIMKGKANPKLVNEILTRKLEAWKG
jgi:aspartyl-tRNA(Asn)/glutamyl-tRNA(Gln) amidotransferase subunit B